MIRQFTCNKDGTPMLSGFRTDKGDSTYFVFQVEGDKVYQLYSAPVLKAYPPHCNKCGSVKPLDETLTLTEIPQDKLYFQETTSQIAKEYSATYPQKKCSCNFNDLMNFGCKCGGI